jgi:L-ascorbate metabolism protein UlaG (beta-lactamase superfamily)
MILKINTGSMRTKFFLLMAGILSACVSSTASSFSVDTFKTKSGKEVAITFIKHGSLMLSYDGLSIQVDPVSGYANYGTFPKADLILVTHEHGDHLDPKAIDQLTGKKTLIVTNEAVSKKLDKGLILKNGEKKKFSGQFTVEAVPAYNYTPGREMYHPRNRDNGYILTMEDLRIYIAGDTEDIPELDELKNIDVAFLPVNQPYTMTIPQAVRAAKVLMPKVLYPYHFGNTDVKLLKEKLTGSGIDVRIRKME